MSFAAQGEKGLLTVVAASHSGLTTSELNSLLDFLRNNNFKTFIVSGGVVEFKAEDGKSVLMKLKSVDDFWLI